MQIFMSRDCLQLDKLCFEISAGLAEHVLGVIQAQILHSSIWHTACMYSSKVVNPFKPNWLIAPGFNPSFCSMKRLGVLLLPLDGMPAHHRLLPSILSSCPNKSLVPMHLYTLGGERHCKRKVSRPRIQHNNPGQGSTPDLLRLPIFIVSPKYFAIPWSRKFSRCFTILLEQF